MTRKRAQTQFPNDTGLVDTGPCIPPTLMGCERRRLNENRKANVSQITLCVEDEEDTGNLIQTILTHEGLCVSRARADRQAICPIEILLPPLRIRLDIAVPYVNGFELFGALCRNPDWQHMPIVMVGADYDEPDTQRAPVQIYILATSTSE
jgi:CheY-like chemotaxis protein